MVGYSENIFTFKILGGINPGHLLSIYNESHAYGKDERKDEERRKELERMYDEVYCYL